MDLDRESERDCSGVGDCEGMFEVACSRSGWWRLLVTCPAADALMFNYPTSRLIICESLVALDVSGAATSLVVEAEFVAVMLLVSRRIER